MTQQATLRSKLKPALITSFSVLGYARAFKYWPRDVAIDLYCFMQGDLGGANAAVYLAKLATDPTLVDSTLKSIVRAHEAAGRSERIVALSSFLPQIWSPRRNNQDGALGIAPVLGLIKLAKALRVESHPVHTIELVGGTRIVGLWHGKWDGTKPHPSGKTETFYAFRDTDAVSPVRQLARTLKDICSPPNLSLDDDLRLAVELEPGPLYVLNTSDALKTLQDEIAAKPLAGIAGFNLDIAHWQLAQLRADHLGNCSNFLEHVVHAHISDHAKGHFGDVPIGDLGFELNTGTAIEERLSPFRQWLDLLANAWFGANSNDRPYRKSDYVSIEMEACRGTDAIQQSVRALRGLLSE
jgi:hypothetical protein